VASIQPSARRGAKTLRVGDLTRPPVMRADTAADYRWHSQWRPRRLALPPESSLNRSKPSSADSLVARTRCSERTQPPCRTCRRACPWRHRKPCRPPIPIKVGAGLHTRSGTPPSAFMKPSICCQLLGLANVLASAEDMTLLIRSRFSAGPSLPTASKVFTPTRPPPFRGETGEAKRPQRAKAPGTFSCILP